MLWSVYHGVVGGLVATAVMTVYRLPVFHALPPTSEFWATYLGDEDADSYPLRGLLLHAAYGAGAGGVFGALFAVVAERFPSRRGVVGVSTGVAYGLLLSVFGSRVLFERVLDDELEGDSALVFHVGHAIYGATLGTWLSTRDSVEDVYD
ncbi:DUF6789 family protein [Halobacterium zhouii]|uniref:DUF6789 family protein n=1 Tax=Halobacterium zhouii TaxID=2902624 RepID=UPI001E4BE485|nr:DUF6789 family protein [Halobacterium zhouii]